LSTVCAKATVIALRTKAWMRCKISVRDPVWCSKS
jgi:hypothetical protein